MPIGKQKKKDETTEVSSSNLEVSEEQFSLRSDAENSKREYEKIEDTLASQSVLENGNKFLAIIEDFLEKVKNGNQLTSNDNYLVEYSSVALVGQEQRDNVLDFLKSKGYSEQQLNKLNNSLDKVGEEAYVNARMNGKSDEEARAAARKAQAEMYQPIYDSLETKADREMFQELVSVDLRQGEIAARALKTGDADIIHAAATAETTAQQKAVVRENNLMTDFAADAFFLSTQAMLLSMAVGNISAGSTEMGAADEQVGFIFDEAMQNELLAQDDTQNLASMNAMIEELIDADKEKGEASGEAPKVADLDEETQDKLEKFGVSEDATLKDAIEFMKKARESMQENIKAVREIRSDDYFAKRGEDVGENVKIPPFYKQETALEIIEDGKREGGVISENPAQFMALASIEFIGDGSARTGTLDELPGEHDFGNQQSPEAVVLEALRTPLDRGAQEAMKSVLSNPVNVDVRAALLEAFARAKEQLEG